nr:MAG TPA: hypothetical protein [Caudoviricetes sp.]
MRSKSKEAQDGHHRGFCHKKQVLSGGNPAAPAGRRMGVK